MSAINDPLGSSTFSFVSHFSTQSSLDQVAKSDGEQSLAANGKQRRGSLAMRASPRLVPPWNFRDDTQITNTSAAARGTKIRKISSTSSDALVRPDNSSAEKPITARKARKKWTPEETQNLINGCTSHGVGSWKAILQDPRLTFDGRTPSDLKDKFRTSFPAAYAKHYPNATTHLSSSSKNNSGDASTSALPKPRREEPSFFKAPAKRRRPFSAEEDEALKRGYEKYGCIWASIAQDPIFAGVDGKNPSRRSTDLRDRFRNAFPDLYAAAGYKPRPTVKKRGRGTTPVLGRSATTDDALSKPSPTSNRAMKKSRSVPASVVFSGSDSELSDEDEEPGPSNDQQFSDTTRIPGTTSPLPMEQPQWPATSSSAPTHSQQRSMIGKSAWDASEWFSHNPRLGMSSSSSVASPGSLSVSLSSPLTSMNALDGLDLSHYTNSGAYSSYHQFSEDFADEHSAFSDPMMSHVVDAGPMSFGGFTHHSASAGDLIFGARTHQPTFTSLSFNTMYNPSLTMQQQRAEPQQQQHQGSPSDSPQVGVYPMMLRTEEPQFDYHEPTSFGPEDFGLMQQQEMEPHPTPPATPAPSVNHHSRSLSVPPLADVIPPLQRPKPGHSLSQPLLFPDMRLPSNPQFMEGVNPAFPGYAAHQHQTANAFDLSFLDLHYNNTNTMSQPVTTNESRRGQALDLASSSSSQRFPPSSWGGLKAPPQRRHSVRYVSPHEVLGDGGSGSGFGAKRKRASLDSIKATFNFLDS